jgi:uncharacterized Zn-binding protein involved in type VI secretion
MNPVARVDDTTACPLVAPNTHTGGPLANATPVHLHANGRPVIRLGDYAQCVLPAPRDVVFSGAATFTVCGLPVAHVGSAMVHGGTIVTGSPDFMVGGPSFALPANLVFAGSPEFQNAAILDLYLISLTPSGQEMFTRLEDAGQTVTINEHFDVNGFCSPVNQADADAGTPTGSSVLWNPSYRSNAFTDDGTMIPQPPQSILFHELAHALANAEGRQRHDVDPDPPASQTGIAEEEAQAIGTGSHNDDYPSENSLRADWGLPRRDNHSGTGGPHADEQTPLDLRLGAC